MSLTIHIQRDAPVQLYRVLHDAEQPAGIWRNGLPEVFWVNELHTPFGQDWQLLSYAMNPGMTGGHWRALYGAHEAFMNGSGFPQRDGDDPRADFVNRQDLGARLPQWDKTRFCGGATITGQEDGDDLIVDIMDGFGPAPTLDWMLAHPTLYFHAVNSTLNGITRFPQGDDAPVLVPLVGSGIAFYPLSKLQKLPLGSPIPDPYRIYL